MAPENAIPAVPVADEPVHVEDIPSTMQPVEPKRFVSREAAARYVSFFVATQVLILLSTFVIPGTNWFLWHDHYPGLRNFGYSQRAGRLDCEVLIYGDSSSLTGVNPAIIRAMTGMKTCNVSEGTTIQGVVGSDVPLLAYLKQNAPPRFIVGMWTPTHLNPDLPPFYDYMPEGVVYGMQFGERKQMLRYLLRKPKAAVKFSIWVLQSLAQGAVDEVTGAARHQLDARADRDARLGQWPYPKPAETHCSKFDYRLTPAEVGRWERSVAAFRRKYTSAYTTVVINIAPVPECDLGYDAYKVTDAGLYDNKLDRLPIADFNEGDVHFSEAGARYISEQIAKQIPALIEKQNEGPAAP